MKDGLGGALGNRTDAVNHYQKTEKKRKREMKDLKKNNIIYIMVKKSGSRCDPKKIKKTNNKSPKECSYSRSDDSISDSDSYSSLSRDSERE